MSSSSNIDKMKRLLMILICMIFLISFVSSEQLLWNTVLIDESESLVKYHAYYQFDDTSLTGIGKNKDIPITLLYVVQDLPYNLSPTYSGEVDWCNFSISHFKNIYDSEGLLINTTTEYQAYYFANQSLTTGSVLINLRSSDSMTSDMSCHFTDPASLYVENLLVGRFTTFMPSFECKGCEKYSLEELTNQAERNDATSSNELEVYNQIQTVIDWNFTLWLILSWIIKIGFLVIGIGLIFFVGYYFYKYLKDLEKSI